MAQSTITERVLLSSAPRRMRAYAYPGPHAHADPGPGRTRAASKDEPLMEVVQAHPSAAAFPGGESMRAMQTRAAEAVREWNARVERDHGADAVYLMCSHGDVIKSLVADALGLHLDLFQRISAEPCSITALRYTRLRPVLVRLR